LNLARFIGTLRKKLLPENLQPLADGLQIPPARCRQEAASCKHPPARLRQRPAHLQKDDTFMQKEADDLQKLVISKKITILQKQKVHLIDFKVLYIHYDGCQKIFLSRSEFAAKFKKFNYKLFQRFNKFAYSSPSKEL
jgi:hypothetical protein